MDKLVWLSNNVKNSKLVLVSEKNKPTGKMQKYRMEMQNINEDSNDELQARRCVHSL